jgi:hypothetical protein
MNDKKNIKRQDIWFLSVLSVWSLLFLLLFVMSLKMQTIWPAGVFMKSGVPESVSRAGNPTLFYWALTMFFILFLTPWLSLFIALYKGRPRFFSESAKITQAANGHLMLSFGHIPLWAYAWIEWHLTYSQGFRRIGRRVFGRGITIVPDFIRGNVRLHAGSDNDSGTYLLAISSSGDRFLLKFSEEIGCKLLPDATQPPPMTEA